MHAQADHLVVVASSLEQGVAWCEKTLGVTPAPGGEHPLMGTHNRLLRVATVDFPRAYLEVIAINLIAAHARRIRACRWFDMDCAVLQAQIAQHGPQLVHWVASVADIQKSTAALAQQGIARGEAIEASRPTPRGLLQWQITVRPDGQRLFDGCLPTLIEWGDVHPVAALPDSGVTLQSLAVSHPQADALQKAFDTLGVRNVPLQTGAANLRATLQTPRGRVTLESKGI